ncbi:MAG: hypothetical protein KBA82_08150 [Nitrosomonas sp.]|nr:hypothetical protein [Nitrosomonas sp.]MBP7112930.1 hypothetical protein [Nitrosomonas sp.]
MSFRETLINSANEMKHEAHGTQQPRHINMIGEGASTAQRSDPLVQSINQRFPRKKRLLFLYTLQLAIPRGLATGSIIVCVLEVSVARRFWFSAP